MSPLPPPLQHYLSTHLTGASGATQMLRDLAERLDAEDLRSVVAELEDEQRQVEAVMAAMDLSPSVVTRSSAMVSELASRAGRVAVGLANADLRVLGELEAMITGINGKKAMWRLLPHLVEAHPPLAALDCEALLAQAERQESVVERHRLLAGLRALDGRTAGAA